MQNTEHEIIDMKFDSVNKVYRVIGKAERDLVSVAIQHHKYSINYLIARTYESYQNTRQQKGLYIDKIV